MGGRRPGRVAYVAVLALALACLGAPAAPASTDDPAARLYRPETVNVIKLELPQSSIDALKANPEADYQPGTFSMAETDGTPDGIGAFSPPLAVTVRLKGSGSFRPLGQKAGFKIKFGKKATFLGLRKMTLNNMVQDTSMTHEALSYRAFRAMGVRASRTSFADLIVNGQDYGIHLNVENLDKVALEKRFGIFQEPPQHLYEGEYNADATAGASGLLEVDEGEADDRSDLAALVAANGKPNPAWFDSVSQRADLNQMTRMWMVEKYIGHIDGYSGEDGVNRPNNFFLYSDAAKVFQMLPWGTDQTWVFRPTFMGSAGSLFDGCLASVNCKALYRGAAEKALATIPALDLGTMASCIANRLRPWQEREPPAMRQGSAADIRGAVAATGSYVSSRPAELATAFGLPAPKSVPAGAPCPAYGAGEEAATGPDTDPAASMYRPDTVNVINLTLPQESIEKLDAQPDEYVEGTFSLAETNGTPQSVGPESAPLTIGIRLKGQLGSQRSLAQKAAFKLKLNWVKGQQFRGLKKMTLNNMVQDPSGIHEALAYDLFRSSGVPAPRTGYAYVYVNGVDYGLHLNLETLDDIALEKRLGPFEHLYEGAYGSDVESAPGATPQEVADAAAGFEVDEGDEDDRSDLEALIAKVDPSVAGDWSQRVGSVADLKEMTRMWAVEKYVGHWDGYAGQEGSYWPNNYYLHSDDSSWFRLLPWGVDQTWSSHLGFDGDAGALFDGCLADSSCAEMYRRSARDLQEVVAGEDLDSLATETAARLNSWIAKEQGNGPRHEFTVGEFESAVQATRDFVASRPGELAAWLAGQPPVAPATQVGLALQPDSIIADGASSSIVTATVADAAGNPIPGEQIVFSSSDPNQQIGATTDNDDGTYSARVTSSRLAGVATIAAVDSDQPGLGGSAQLTQRPGPATKIALSLLPSSIVADGAATTTATATVTDANGNRITGDAVAFSSTDPAQVIGSVTDNGDGTYSAQITASISVGASAIAASDASVAPSPKATATLTQRAGPPAHLTLVLGASAIPADGHSTTTAIATVTDAVGNALSADTVTFSSSDPAVRFGSVQKLGNGAYATQVVSSTVAAPVTITATDSSATPVISDRALLTLLPGPAASLVLAVAPSSIPADGKSTASATATITDLAGNRVPGEAISFSSTDAGQRFGAVSDRGDGTYTVAITSSARAGEVTITALDATAAPALSGSAALEQSVVPIPAVRILSKPARKTRDRTPTFRFTADRAVAGFRCKVDSRPFRRCDSPFTTTKLAPGTHRFAVRAVGAEGSGGDVTSFGFTVRPRQHRAG